MKKSSNHQQVAAGRRRTVFFLVLLLFAWVGWSMWYAISFLEYDDGFAETSAQVAIRHLLRRRRQQDKRATDLPVEKGGYIPEVRTGANAHVQEGHPPIVNNGSRVGGSEYATVSESTSEVRGEPGRAAGVSTADASEREIIPGDVLSLHGHVNYATLHTNYGLIHWDLHHEDAPATVANIIRMSKIGVFNHSCFYRYEKGFVLQGGLHCNKRQTRTKGAKQVAFEYKRPNEKLTVALARAGGDLNSGGTEFFINMANNTRALGPQKKGGYAVFATVIGDESLATIAVIKKLKTVRKRLTLFVDPQPVIEFISISNERPAP